MLYRLLTSLLLLGIFVDVYAQPGAGFNFQAVVRNAAQEVIANKTVALRITLLQGSTTGTPVYTERHTPTSDAGGLVSVIIGKGTVLSGAFTAIDWGSTTHFIKIELDPQGGNTYALLGVQQLLAVPYALHAAQADTTLHEADTKFVQSVAAAITSVDTAYWNRKLEVEDTVELSNRIDTKLSTRDTSAMLTSYFRDSDTTSLNLVARFASKIGPNDTLSLSSRIDSKLSSNDTLSLSARIDAKVGLPQSGNIKGNILYWNSAEWVRLSNGKNGQILQLQNGVPVWSGPAFATLTTDEVSNITSSSAYVGGHITSDGGASIIARGVIYGTTPNLMLGVDSILEIGLDTGAYSATLTGLVGNTVYYVRAFATNMVGIAYGEERSFSTLPPSLPIVNLLGIESVSQTGASVLCNVTNDGGAAVTQRGVVYGINPNPTLSNSFTQNGSGTGSFNSIISGLLPNTTYYLRAYATNSAGTGYGIETSIYTSELFKMIPIPAGQFSMGCTPGDPNCGSAEFPVHRVTLDAFQICETEVTQAQWQAVMGSNPSYFSNCQQCPVEEVSWYDVAVFCNRLSEIEGLAPCYYSDAGFTQVYGKSGSTWSLPNSGTVYWNPAAKGYRLPTEAEWEYAARGGSETNIYSGSNNIDAVAWYANNNYPWGTKPVKGKAPNGYGLYDMSGNLWEWCWDWFGPYSADTQNNPTGPTYSEYRSIRGGNWFYEAPISRVTDRAYRSPIRRHRDDGFRFVREL